MYKSELTKNILRQCAGDCVQLPYNSEQEIRTKELAHAGFIRYVLEDDQPTYIITASGRAYLATL